MYRRSVCGWASSNLASQVMRSALRILPSCSSRKKLGCFKGTYTKYTPAKNRFKIPEFHWRVLGVGWVFSKFNCWFLFWGDSLHVHQLVGWVFVWYMLLNSHPIWNQTVPSLESTERSCAQAQVLTLYMGVSKHRGVKPPKSSILIGFPLIFTIHFGGFRPIFGNTHITLWIFG